VTTGKDDNYFSRFDDRHFVLTVFFCWRQKRELKI
jgi:hypothetical protein